MPIIDYHNHLPANEVAANKKFSNLTEIWLKGDHYKWRAMRGLGVNEKYITGQVSDEVKFKTWAACVPQTIRNPLFHWTQMELNNPFKITSYLNPDSAGEIYTSCNELLQEDNFSTRGLLQHFNVEMACTTDDPCDDLSSHKKIASDNIYSKVIPGFRPDTVLNISNRENFINYIYRLQHVSGIHITGLNSLFEALRQRVDYFHENGCRIADHGLSAMPFPGGFSSELENELEVFIQKKNAPYFSAPGKFSAVVLQFLCRMYHEKSWVQQFHLGPLRNNNTRMLLELGTDSGFDSIGDFSQAQSLSSFLNELDKTNELTKTVIYNNNPADNELFAAMAGNFNDGSIKGKVQYGSGWWWLDQADGMEKQLNALSSIGTVSTFIGMLTDSRSFLSFSRHDYFRRILCNLFGDEMEKGLLPDDEEWIGNIVKNICYYNAKEYFNL